MVAWEAHARPSEDAEEDWSRDGGRKRERQRKQNQTTKANKNVDSRTVILIE